MIRRSKLKELVERIVKQTIDEIGLSLASTGNSTPAPVISPVEQEKINRIEKQAARKDVQLGKRELDQARAKEKSLEKDYKMTRRITVPNLKRDLDAKKKRASSL